MRKFLFACTILSWWVGFGQASTQMNNALNTDTGLNPPNLIYTLAPPLSTWQQTNVSNFRLPVQQVTGLSAGQELTYNPGTGVISKTKVQETSSGVTAGSGTYTFTFAKTYSVPPNVQSNIIGGTDSQIIKIGIPTTTSVTVTVRNRVDVIGLLPTWSNVNGANVDILVTEK